MKKILVIVVGLVVIGLFYLNGSINRRIGEGKALDRPPVALSQNDTQNSKWEQNYPYQYSSYIGALSEGSSSVEVKDELEANPELVVLWAGYGFSKDYNKPRGHGFAVVDTLNTLRTGAPKDPNTGPMPATCWSRKSPDVPRKMKEEGVAKFYEGKWARHGKDIVNPIGCADCHDAKSGKLAISRPALKEALERTGVDLSSASHQEMRSLVCAQCHVEYYFKKPGNYLTFPWDNGNLAEQVEEYYDKTEFKDWTHKVSKAPMLKAQHPGYELFKEGIHAKRGVSCADCHMPYKTLGGVKFSDHHVQSPMHNVANSCQQCHRQSEATLASNVMDMKVKYLDLKGLAEKELVQAHVEAGKAWELGAKKDLMNPALQDIRHAQWRWDYATAAHGAFFHAPQETMRTLGSSIKAAGDARRKLQRILINLGHQDEVPYPNIKTKAAAQKYIGLDMDKLKSEKKSFLNGLAKDWWDEAGTMDVDFRPRVEPFIER